MIIQFGEWLPDWEGPDAGTANGAPARLRIAKNVIWLSGAYRAFPQQDDTADHTITHTALGAAAHDSYLYIGTGQTIKRKPITGVLDDVTPAGGFTYAQLNNWEFIQWDNLTIATGTGIGDYSAHPPLLVCTLAATAFGTLATDFRCDHIGVVNRFLVGGSTYGVGASNKRQLRWSGFDTPANFTAGVNQSDSEDLLNGGNIHRIMGGEYVGYVFQAEVIRRLTYVGSPSVFQIDEVEGSVGTEHPASIVEAGGHYYYLSNDGFYVFDGARSVSISNGKINDFLFSDSTYLYRPGYNGLVRGIKLSGAPLILWTYKKYPGSSSDSYNDVGLIYNYQDARWTFADVSSQVIAPALASTDPTHFYYNITTGNVLKPVNRVGGLYGYYLGFGNPATAIIETAGYEAAPGRRSVLKSLRPLLTGTDTAGPSLSVAGREAWDDAVSFGVEKTIQSSGLARFRKSARYHSIRFKQEERFDAITGVDVEHAAKGRR